MNDPTGNDPSAAQPMTPARWLTERLLEQRAQRVRRFAHGAAAKGLGLLPGAFPNPLPEPSSLTPFPEGDPRVPPPGWAQQPERPINDFVRDASRTIRWGDLNQIQVPANPAGGMFVEPTLAIIETTLTIPAVCKIRLSAVDVSGHAIAATDVVQWTLEIGVGSANQNKIVTTAIGDAAGVTDTDYLKDYPVQHLRVSAKVSISQDVALERTVVLVAHLSPYNSWEWMVG